VVSSWRTACVSFAEKAHADSADATGLVIQISEKIVN
jgi:hypothetical protein